MVVLAASVTTKTGKPLLSRQFVDITRVRIEGLLAAFSKLKGLDREHTFIETENVRYLYQPLESLYIVIITNKQSNIMEDLDTLHLLAKLVPEYCRILNEKDVKEFAFELSFAFDEVVAGGYKEKVTLQQVKTFTEMDSHEERIAEIVQKNKEREAKEESKRRQKEMEHSKKMGGMGGGGSGMPGFGGGMGGGGYGGGYGGESSFAVKSKPAKPTQKQPSKKGMVLGKATGKGGGKTLDVLKALEAEGDIVEEETPVAAAGGKTADAASMKKESLHIKVEEKVNASIDKEGGLESLDIKGMLSLIANDPSVGHVAVQLANNSNGFQFQTHPQVNKPLFNKNNIIALKDPSRSFPLQQPLGVLRWRMQSTDENDIPLSISCWPSPGPDAMTVNMEYELNNPRLVLQDLKITIPIPGGRSPVVENADGSYNYSNKDQTLTWSIPIVDEENGSGSMEFTIAYGGDGSALFPVVASFKSSQTICNIDVGRAVQVEDKSPVRFSKETALSTDRYEVV